jgi:predicted NUDIX family NTP pyrophosphohydrolase
MRPMAKKISAGILLYRIRDHALQVFLVHPGGPYWARKDEGAWSIPKGEVAEGTDPLATANIEFQEETGSPLQGQLIALEPLEQPSGKLVHAWAVEGDIDPASIRSNTFALEWPPRSGRTQKFPEVDRADWFDLATARRKLLAGQQGFLAQLKAHLFPPPPAKSAP